ncbi:hypothetical protein FS837_005226 [Tulasnella sp. UAMH 9824]|nr:hypothetical protein FS837_005226 [Tulasnella sp. UAMH 9824]
MLGNIFRSRRSTATSPQFQIGPTTGHFQPSAPRPPSKLLTKLKKLIRSGSSSKKDANVASHNSNKGGRKSTRFERAVDNRAPSPFKAIDHEAPRTQSIGSYRYPGRNSPPTQDFTETGVPSTTVFLPPFSSFPLNPSSAPHPPTTHTSPLCQQPVQTTPNGLDIRVVRSYLAELENDEAQTTEIKLSKQPKPVVVHTAPFVQSHSAEVHWYQPADGQLLPAATASAERKKTPKDEGSKWSNTSRDLQERKLYWAKRVMEYRGSQAQFRKAEDQDQVQPPRQPHARHSSKPSQDSNMAVENVPLMRWGSSSMTRELPRWSGQGVHPLFASQGQGPNAWPIERSNDERSLVQAHTAQSTPGAARTPLGLLNQNVELHSAAPVANQADDDEADDASCSSYDHALQTSAPRPSLWFGQNRLP